MSYNPYGQFTTGDSYSTPTTPIDGFPQWETVEREQEQQQAQQSQQLQQQSPEQLQQSQSQHHSPSLPTPTFQLIHLEDATSPTLDSGSQPTAAGVMDSGAVDDTPIHLHHIVHHDPSASRSVDVRLEPTLGNDLFRTLGYSNHEASSSSATGMTQPTSASGPGPAAVQSGSSSSTPVPGPSSASNLVMRSARSTRQFHQSAHPYQRPQSATSVGSSVSAAAGPSKNVRSQTQMREAAQIPLRFVHHNLLPTTPQVAVSSPAGMARTTSASGGPSALPSPASASGRMLLGSGAGSVTGSPVAQLQQSTLLHVSPQPSESNPSAALIQSLQRKKYIIRADTHYEPENGVLLVVLELPGVEKKDIKLSLTTSRHTRVRQLRVWGVLNPTFPLPSNEVVRMFPESCARERKFGEFSRTFSVPSDLQREHVKAVMKKGVLTLRIDLGPPAETVDLQDIPVD